jgi:hypothetical protein
MLDSWTTLECRKPVPFQNRDCDEFRGSECAKSKRRSFDCPFTSLRVRSGRQLLGLCERNLRR